MKNFNLCRIALALFSFAAAINSSTINASPLTASNVACLTQTERVMSIDPDWKKLTTHFIDPIVGTTRKVE